MAQDKTSTITSSSNSSSNTKQVLDVDRPRGGVVTVWFDLGLGLAEETVKTSFGLLQEVRSETADRVAATIDFVDGVNQGFFRLGKKVNDRVDRVTNKALDSGEKAALSLVTAFRRTGRGAQELANTTAAALIAEEARS